MTYKDKNVIDRSSLYNERYQIDKTYKNVRFAYNLFVSFLILCTFELLMNDRTYWSSKCVVSPVHLTINKL